MTLVEVHKLTTSGTVAVRYDARVAEHLPNGVRLDARWERPPLSLGYATFEPGDHFAEWYFTDRWYNIFEISDALGTLKGWYCNIAAPATITEQVVACKDLLLDLWVAPDGTMRVLDEDEFAADRTLDEATRARALAALAELQALVEQRAAPFQRLSGSAAHGSVVE